MGNNALTHHLQCGISSGLHNFALSVFFMSMLQIYSHGYSTC